MPRRGQYSGAVDRDDGKIVRKYSFGKIRKG
jgi:hypothetical protein